jgi:FixJ family two-component response regulator
MSDTEAGNYLLPAAARHELEDVWRVKLDTAPIISITAHNDAAVRRRAIEGGAINLLHKPFAAAELLETVQTSVRGRNVSH